MNIKTAAALADIRSAAAAGQTRIAPSLFSAFHGRAAVSAAFRMAKSQGLIELAYTSCIGTPVYQAAGVKAATIEAATAVKH